LLDSNTVLVSLKEEDETNALYKYNIKANKLTIMCKDFLLYNDSYVKVTDANHFSVFRPGSYLKIVNNKISVKLDFSDDNKQNVQYNEDNKKLLFTKENSEDKNKNPDRYSLAAYWANEDFSDEEKLPFEGVYSVQWADNENILVAYKSGAEGSFLARYNITTKHKSITELQYRKYFYNPVISNSQFIGFLYEDSCQKYTPYGFLDLSRGTYNGVMLEDANPVSVVNNGYLAAFRGLQEDKAEPLTQIYTYSYGSNTIELRSTKTIKNPSQCAISKDGKVVIFTTEDNGETKFYRNTAKDTSVLDQKIKKLKLTNEQLSTLKNMGYTREEIAEMSRSKIDQILKDLKREYY